MPISFASFSARQNESSPFFSLQQPSPTALGKPTPALPPRPLRQVCPQANVTQNTRIACCVSFGSCVPWWLKILATTRKPRSSRTSFRKAQQEVGLKHPGWASHKSSESGPASWARELYSCTGLMLGLMLCYFAVLKFIV